MPTPKFVTQPNLSLVGVTQSYTCTLEQISRVRTELRTQFWRDFLHAVQDIRDIPPVLYGLHHAHPSQEKDDEQTIFYTTALEPHLLPKQVTREVQPI